MQNFYHVWDFDFRYVTKVRAYSAEQALEKAKKLPKVHAPMVAPVESEYAH